MGPIHDDKYRLIDNQYISQLEKIVVTFEQSNDLLKICFQKNLDFLKNLVIKIIFNIS